MALHSNGAAVGGRNAEETGSATRLPAQPLVSVAMLAYNHGRFLADAIEGVLIQRTSFPIELVIGEDCSTDNTREVAQAFRQRRPDLIRVVTSASNVGVHENLKRTFDACRGKYIAFCEGDDYWTDPEKLQKQAEFLEAHANCVICYHDCQPFDEHGDLPVDFGGARRDLTALELQTATPIHTLTACFRNVVRTWPPEFDHAPIPDLFFWSLLGSRGDGKFLRNIGPARYRVHAGGILSKASTRKKHDMNLATLSALYLYYARTGQTDVSELLILRMLRTMAVRFGPSRFLVELSVLTGRYLTFPFRRLVRCLRVGRK